MKRVGLALLLVFPVLALLLFGLWLFPRDDLPTPPAGLAPGSFTGQDCWFSDALFARSDCAWLAPRDQDATASTALPVVRLRHSLWRPSRRATIYLSGGPGGPTYLDHFGIMMWRDWAGRMGLDHDLVLYDQRGTGHAQPALGCDPLQDVTRLLLDRELDVDAQWAEVEPVLLACASHVAEADRARGLYSTATAAQDLRELIDALRMTWGYEDIAVYGVSYGSRLAVEALADSPPAVARVVLDSYYPAAVDLTLAFAESFARQIEAFEHDCRQRRGCTLDTEPLRALLARALARADGQPRRILAEDWYSGDQQPIRVDPPTLMSMVEYALYADHDADSLPQRLREMLGDEIGEAWQTLASEWLVAELDPDFSVLAHVLIECRDNAPRTQAQEHEALAAHPDWFAALRSPTRSFQLCDLLGVPPAPLPRRILDLPTLLVAAEFDPRTPAEFALQETRGYPRLSTLLLPIAGHSVVDFDDCAARVTGRFLNSGKPPAAGECGAKPAGEAMPEAVASPGSP